MTAPRNRFRRARGSIPLHVNIAFVIRIDGAVHDPTNLPNPLAEV
jgi:hypothetical protein